MSQEPTTAELRAMAEEALRVAKEYEESGNDPYFMADLAENAGEIATALLTALDRVDELETGIDRFQKEEGITIGKKYFERLKLPIPISAEVNVEKDILTGEFACSGSYEDGPPEREVDYTQKGRSFRCNYCGVTLSVKYAIEDHIQEKHSQQR